jgi:hypothetical protein
VYLPARARIRIYQYADFSRVWLWSADGIPVDFTGATAACALRVTPADATPAIAVTTTTSTAGSIVLGTAASALIVGVGFAALGTVQLNFTRAANALITAPVLHGELLIAWPDLSVQEFLQIDALVYAGSTY